MGRYHALRRSCTILTPPASAFFSAASVGLADSYLEAFWTQSTSIESLIEIWDGFPDDGMLVQSWDDIHSAGANSETSGTEWLEAHAYYIRCSAAGYETVVTGPWNFD